MDPDPTKVKESICCPNCGHIYMPKEIVAFLKSAIQENADKIDRLDRQITKLELARAKH